MLEKEVRVSATDDMGFGSFADTHVLRVKNEDAIEARDALMGAGIKVIPYANAGMAYAEDLAEKTLTLMVDKRAEEQEVNGVPMSDTDRVLADEAVYNTRRNVGAKFYDELLTRERAFAASMVNEIVENAHKNISVEESVKLGLLTPGTLIEKLVDDNENQGNIENLLEDELEKHREFGSKPWRSAITQEDECCCNGSACKKVVLR